MSPFVAAALLSLVAVSSAITLEDCQAKPESGLCLAYFVRHFFNETSGQCENFVYGGCGGNKNNFLHLEECQSLCADKFQKQQDCESEAEVGLCRANFPRFYFNKQSGQCEKFSYGGCGGNLNNYHSLEDCQNTCQPAIPATQAKEEVVCTAEPSVGICRGAFHKFFFNKHTGKCHPFVYGGCGGNTNNFDSEDECQQTCGQTKVERVNCAEEKKVGMCMALIPAFHYNAQTGQCENFYYGGCGGNTNRFYSKQTCQATCGGFQKVETNEVEEPQPWTLKNCFLQPETGKCLAAIPRFHFNRSKGMCESFIYGGCGGNANNFATQKDCEDHCLVA